MDQAPQSGSLCRRDDRRRARAVACVEPRRIGRVDHARDVDRCLGTCAEPCQRRRIFERPGDPFDALV